MSEPHNFNLRTPEGKRASMGICGPAAQQHSSADIQGNHQICASPVFVATDKICTQIKEKASGIEVEQSELEKLIS